MPIQVALDKSVSRRSRWTKGQRHDPDQKPSTANRGYSATREEAMVDFKVQVAG